ncbi:MAG: aminotransferase class I/II-fold pyridoxal phosphate-dependent enzyme [Peptococcaceae bacterium]
MNKNPIIEKMVSYLAANPVSFHTPGHKNGQLIPDELLSLNLPKMWQLDLTEIEGLDNLHNPGGCILESESKTAALFGAKASYYLINGTSVGIQAAIIALANSREPIFIPRNSHQAVYNGLILANAEPVYLPVAFNKELGIPLGIEPQILQKYIDRYPLCKKIVITHPSYQGISYHIERIIRIARENGLEIIMDEAHGSHLYFNQDLPPTGLELGADIVIQSWHKTLPVLTQASVLHVNKNYQGPDLRAYLNLLQTTSPSYLLLASLDGCRNFLEEKGKALLAKTIFKIDALKKRLTGLTNIKIFSPGDVRADPLKMCITAKNFSGHKLAQIFREKYQIFPELAEETYCLLILGIDVPDQTIGNLEKALWDLDKSLGGMISSESAGLSFTQYIPGAKLSLREAFFAEKEIVNFRESAGRVCSQFVIKYPPGIPLIVPGEEIDRELIALLEKDRIGYNVQDGISVVRNRRG